jgi:hypothetical protein
MKTAKERVRLGASDMNRWIITKWLLQKQNVREMGEFMQIRMKYGSKCCKHENRTFEFHARLGT